jgi:ABC-type transporter Mla MlaB component
MDQGSPGFLQLSEVDLAGVASLIGFLKQQENQENGQMTLEPGTS